MQEMHFSSTPAPAAASSSSPAINLETQQGRLAAIKQSFRKANSDEKLDLLRVAFKSLNKHPIANGLKVCVFFFIACLFYCY
jgi:hypothetical protein